MIRFMGMKPASQDYRQRSIRPGPEANLLAAALDAGIPVGRRGCPMLLREPELPVGCPDALLLYARAKGASVFRGYEPTTRHLRLLHQIWLCRGVRIEELGRLVSLTTRATDRLVRELVSFKLVVRTGSYVRARAIDLIFSLSGIVAIEAKVSDWRKGLRQSLSNLWFASESYLLVPSGVGGTALHAEAKELGVGVVRFDGRRCLRSLRPMRQSLPVSYGSWLVNEWATSLGIE